MIAHEIRGVVGQHDDEWLCLRRIQLAGLADDGNGFDPNSARDGWSHGIMGMQQRVRALGGKFSLESAPGRGTTLRVTVPAPHQ